VLHKPRYSQAELSERKMTFAPIMIGLLVSMVALHAFGVVNDSRAGPILLLYVLAGVILAYFHMLALPPLYDVPRPLIIFLGSSLLGLPVSILAAMVLSEALHKEKPDFGEGEQASVAAVFVISGGGVALFMMVVGNLSSFVFGILKVVALATIYSPFAVVCLFMPQVMLPVFAMLTNRVNCVDGLDWELHVSFVIAMCINATLWGACFGSEDNCKDIKAIFVRAKRCGLYFSAVLDSYTDLTFAALAMSCGSSLGNWALVDFVIGFVVLQQLGGGLLALQAKKEECEWWIVVVGLLCQYPVFDADDFFESKKGCKGSAAAVAVLRTLGEDVPQVVLQLLFTLQVKKNPLVIFSIMQSLANTFASTAMAVKDYVDAGGSYTPLK